MEGIGGKYKNKIQGTSIYIKKPTPLPQSSSTKRQRIKYKRQGSNTCKTTIAMELEEPSDLHLRYAIYYVFVNLLDAPYEEHWSGKE